MPGCMAAMSFIRRIISFCVSVAGASSPFSALYSTMKLVFSTVGSWLRNMPVSTSISSESRSVVVSSLLRIRRSGVSESTRTKRVFSSFDSSIWITCWSSWPFISNTL